MLFSLISVQIYQKYDHLNIGQVLTLIVIEDETAIMDVFTDENVPSDRPKMEQTTQKLTVFLFILLQLFLSLLVILFCNL